LFPLDKRIVIKMKLALVFMLSLWMVVGALSIPMPSMEMIQKSAEFPNGFSLEEEEPLIDENTPDIPEEVIFSEVRKRRNIEEIVDHVLQEVRAKEPELLWDDVARYPHVAFGEMDNDKLGNVNMEDTVEFDEVPFEFVDRDKELTMPERILHKITMGETFGEQFNENLQSILKTPEELEVPNKAISAAKKTISEPERKKEEKANAPKSSTWFSGWFN